MSRTIKVRNRKGEILKKEKIYRKTPLYLIHTEPDNSIFSTAIKFAKSENEKMWLEYYRNALYYKNDRSDCENSIAEILRNICNEDLQKKLLEYLVEQNFNPHTDEINNLPNDIKTEINNIQTFIKNRYGFKRKYKIGSVDFLVLYECNGYRQLAKLFLEDTDVLILAKYSHTTIICNDENLRFQILNYLKTQEEIWKLSKNGVITTKNKRTKLNIFDKMFWYCMYEELEKG